MRRFFLGVATAVAGASACGGGSPGPTGTGGSTISVIIEPSSAPIAVGAQLTLHASVTGPFGISQRVNWRSLQDTIVSVTSAGVVTGLVTGTATVRATWAENSDIFGVAIMTVSGTLEEPPAAIRAVARKR